MTGGPDSYRGDDRLFFGMPDNQAGSGSGIYKMASSLGASFGVAISAAIFTALSANNESIHWLEGVITFAGRQDNVAVRQAALVVLAKHVVHPEHSEKNGVSTQPFQSEEAPDEASS